MTAAEEAEGRVAPLSLYIDLAPDTRGDIEVISRAAIAWSQAIREAAFIIDPFLDVRVELVNGTEGSINLNSRIRALRDTLNDPVKLKAIAIGVAAYFAMEAGSWVVGKGFDAIWDVIKSQIGFEQVEKFTADQKSEIEDIVCRIAGAKAARQKAAVVYYELSKDPAVTGVGVSLTPGKRPAYVVPRSEFGLRAGEEGIKEEEFQRRTLNDRLPLTLLAPSLSEGEYKWKFQIGSKPFWAIMDDEDFKARLRPGSAAAPRMVTGIRMDANVETTQDLREGVWTTTSQKITKVYGLSEPQTQPIWLSSPTEDDQP